MQTRYEDKAGRTGKFDVAATKQDTRDEMAQMKTLFESPPYVTTFLARFPCGVRFLARGKPKTAMSTDSDGGVADAVRMASTNVPRSSEQILHPEKYWHDDKRDEPVVVNDEDVEKLLAAEGAAGHLHRHDRRIAVCRAGRPGQNRQSHGDGNAGLLDQRRRDGLGRRPSLPAGDRTDRRGRAGAAQDALRPLADDVGIRR